MTQRPIKFRAWLNEEKRMVTLDEMDFGYKEELSAIGYDGEGGTLVEVSSQGATVMQFTGLHDRNGKEICEGDIIKCASGPGSCLHEVKWFDRVPADNFVGSGLPGFYLTNMKAGYDFIGEEEVVGNIYENPELLKQ